jgi:hypothetical protein
VQFERIGLGPGAERLGGAGPISVRRHRLFLRRARLRWQSMSSKQLGVSAIAREPSKLLV